MYCKYCGKQIADNTLFCRHCGAEQMNSSPSRQEWENILRSRQRLFGVEYTSSKNERKTSENINPSDDIRTEKGTTSHNTTKPSSKPADIKSLQEMTWFLFGFFIVMIVGLVFFILLSDLDIEPIEYSTENDSIPSSAVIKEDALIYDTETKDEISSTGSDREEDVTPLTYTETILKNGNEPFGKGRYDKHSLSELRVSNYTKLDAVVVLQDKKRRWIRNVYVKHSSSYTITRIPNCICRMKVIQGMKWNAEKDNGKGFPKGGFMENVSFSESSDIEAFKFIPETVEDGVNYPAYSITLHPVVNGNFHTSDISQSDFFTK